MDTDERLVLYQMATQDIRDLKANQWRFSHYGLLVQAGLVAVNTMLKVPEPLPFDELWVFCGLSVVTCLGIGVLIHEAQGRIVRSRRTIDSLREPKEETHVEWLRTYGPIAQDPPRKRWKVDKLFAILFFGVQIVAMVLANGVMLLGAPTSAC